MGLGGVGGGGYGGVGGVVGGGGPSGRGGPGGYGGAYGQSSFGGGGFSAAGLGGRLSRGQSDPQQRGGVQSRLISMFIGQLPAIALSVLMGNPMPAIGSAVMSMFGLNPSDIMSLIGKSIVSGIVPGVETPKGMGIIPFSGQPPTASQVASGPGLGGGGPGERGTFSPFVSGSGELPPQGPAPAPNQPGPGGFPTNLPGLTGGGPTTIAPTGQPALTPMQQAVGGMLDLSPTERTYSGARKLRQLPGLESGIGVR